MATKTTGATKATGDMTRASVDSMCHKLSEYVWLYAFVKHR